MQRAWTIKSKGITGKNRVKVGVEVRIFYDDMGSIGFINTDFVKKMECVGIHCRVFQSVCTRFKFVLEQS